MDYLTNYYKNLCEQLMEKEKQLTKLLNEIAAADVQPGPPAPGQGYPTAPATNPAPSVAPATAPTFTPQGPDRPSPQGYPGGSQDPNYQKEWYEYYKWWQKQDPKWRAKNPLPPSPKKPGTRPQPRPGGGYYPGGPARPIR